MDAFNRLAPYIQDFIYRSQWTEMRQVQVAACEVVFQTAHNVLLTTGTASGKTEAAFLPALTMLYENPSASVGILYVSPLKALINDQFMRLDALLKEGDVSVCKWHGDVSASQKNRLLRNPEGVLQITPESLQSLLINKQEAIIRLFSDLRFIIIDEVHYFMGSPRGLQLLCILEQIQRLANCNPRRIGLSATLGDYAAAEHWLNCGSQRRKCVTPILRAEKRTVRLAMQRFVLHGDETDDTLDSGRAEHCKFLYTQTLHKKALIFAKSRAEVELMMANIRRIAQTNNTPDVYRVHHGSISAALREEAEQDMKRCAQPIVTGATVTLELGIDIGSLDRVIQVGSPFSASSFMQRIGRCGRRGQPAELLFTFEEKNADGGNDILRGINFEFIKTIAIIQLFLEERWVEPIPPANYPYALLYHQTISYLVSQGEVSAAHLAQQVLGLSVFQKISKDDYRLLLQHMLAIGHLQRTERGGLMIGNKAEPIISFFEFYTVFESAQEYLVKEENRSIGTVTAAYPVGTRFALAGRAWESIAINEKTKVLSVKAANGVSKASWTGSAMLDIDTKLLRKMRSILIEGTVYAYLSEDCMGRLTQIRETVRHTGIATSLVTQINNKKYAVFPWIGTRQLWTLLCALEQQGITCNCIRPESWLPIYIEVNFNDTERALSQIVREICGKPIDKRSFTLPDSIQIPFKYNDFVPQELLTKQFVEDYLDGRQIDLL